MQPIASAIVAKCIAQIAMSPPMLGAMDLAGPDRLPIAELVKRLLEARGDPREVVVDAEAGYFGIPISEKSLVPAGEAEIGGITLERWLNGDR